MLGAFLRLLSLPLKTDCAVSQFNVLPWVPMTRTVQKGCNSGSCRSPILSGRDNSNQIREPMNHRTRLVLGSIAVLGLGAASTWGAASNGRFEVSEAPISQTQQAIREHRATCHEIIQQYLDRIRAYDQTTH